MSPQEMDKLAKSRGFKDYKTMLAFYQRQRERTGASAPTEKGEKLRNAVDTSMSWHPKKLLEGVLQKFNKATGQK